MNIAYFVGNSHNYHGCMHLLCYALRPVEEQARMASWCIQSEAYVNIPLALPAQDALSEVFAKLAESGFHQQFHICNL